MEFEEQQLTKKVTDMQQEKLVAKLQHEADCTAHVARATLKQFNWNYANALKFMQKHYTNDERGL